MERFKKWFKRWLNVIIFVVVASVAAPLLVYGVFLHECTDNTDEEVYRALGRDAQGNDLALKPLSNYWRVMCGKSVDLVALQNGIKEWNTKLNYTIFYPSIIDLAVSTVTAVDNEGYVVVTEGLESGKEEIGGLSRFSYDINTGEVYLVEIAINPLSTYNEDYYNAAVLHELGHALLLGDNESSTSIMRKKLNIRGVITDRDIALVKTIWSDVMPDKLSSMRGALANLEVSAHHVWRRLFMPTIPF
ncbi:MAG: hypothetical protein ACXAEU_21050 [Candidatus Hodarchaeales archaeon]|jgi:hypothetical protein